MRRFTKKIIQSGKIIQAKKVKFHQKPINKTAQKAKALNREIVKKKREYLRKIGKLDDYLNGKKKLKFKKKK